MVVCSTLSKSHVSQAGPIDDLLALILVCLSWIWPGMWPAWFLLHWVRMVVLDKALTQNFSPPTPTSQAPPTPGSQFVSIVRLSCSPTSTLQGLRSVLSSRPYWALYHSGRRLGSCSIPFNCAHCEWDIPIVELRPLCELTKVANPPQYFPPRPRIIQRTPQHPTPDILLPPSLQYRPLLLKPHFDTLA